MLAYSLAAVSTSSGSNILCLLLLAGAIIGTVLVLLSLLGINVGRFGRNGRDGYGYLGGPVAVTVVLWVLYFVFCGD